MKQARAVAGNKRNFRVAIAQEVLAVPAHTVVRIIRL